MRVRAETIRAIGRPVLSQPLQENGGQRHHPVLPALAVSDVQHHPLAVDILDPQVSGLRKTQPRGVDRRPQGSVLEVPDRA